MHLTIFNGSPKGAAGTTEWVIRSIIKGLEQSPDTKIATLYLNKTENHEAYLRELKSSDTVLIVFPLYTDCMPGIVMAFFEKLQPLTKSLSGLKLGFVVHSGFPEALHSRPIEKYLEWLTVELDADYLGTIIMGGGNLSAKRRRLFYEVGSSLTAVNKFSPQLTKKIAGIERITMPLALLLRFLDKIGVVQSFWDTQLKRNNAYQDRDAKPYIE